MSFNIKQKTKEYILEHKNNYSKEKINNQLKKAGVHPDIAYECWKDIENSEKSLGQKLAFILLIIYLVSISIKFIFFMEERDSLKIIVYIFGFIVGLVSLVFIYLASHPGFAAAYYGVPNNTFKNNSLFNANRLLNIVPWFLIFFVSLFFFPNHIMSDGLIIKYKFDYIFNSEDFNALNSSSDLFYGFKSNKDFVVFMNKPSEYFSSDIKEISSNNFFCNKFILVRHHPKGDVFYVDCDNFNEIIKSKENFNLTIEKKIPLQNNRWKSGGFETISLSFY